MTNDTQTQNTQTRNTQKTYSIYVANIKHRYEQTQAQAEAQVQAHSLAKVTLWEQPHDILGKPNVWKTAFVTTPLKKQRSIDSTTYTNDHGLLIVSTAVVRLPC